MRKRILKYSIWIVVLLFGVGLYSLNADYLAYTSSLPELELLEAPEDTIPPRYPVAKTTPEEYQDIVKQSPADLRDPENVKTTIEYDLKTNTYIVRTKLGDMEIGTPMSLTPAEYQDYSMQQSLRSYFRQKNEEEFQKATNKQFNLTDMQFNIGAAERIFGPGGVRVRTQGSAEITMGLKTNKNNDPSLPERSRKRTFFNFDESVQLNVQASVGSKVNFGMNYNTETSFDFDSKKLKLAYTGEEDEIIKSLEAGNVSMNTSNSLINGGAALFGMKADLQFGKLRVNALFAQQESESKTVSSKGGVQTKPFEIKVDEYDENRHFFLGHYFYDNYDKFMESLPTVTSGIEISKIEVWVTNKRGNYDQSRNIVAFTDLGENESRNIGNTALVMPSGTDRRPNNSANNLYTTLTTQFTGARKINMVNDALKGAMEGGRDFEKIESARLLESSEYTLNKKLGYISLRTQLQADEVLGVAFSFIYNGKTYQVGEFSTDNKENTSDCIYVKLLKGITMSPDMMFWDLMMKNVYSLGAYSVQKEKFKLNVTYQSDSTGTYVNYLPEGNCANQILIRVLGLDRLDTYDNPNPDGFFDFIDGYTIQAETGKIIFPCVQPFGSKLREKVGNAYASKYVFQELYDSTLTVARQIAEKNKFLLSGEYKASSGSEIDLGATNVARGSVRVTAGGATLTENVDYTVDYSLGRVTILNESIISSGTPVSVSLENQSTFNMQRKTMIGLDLNYQFNKDFMVGATVMHMSEMPLTVKTTLGDVEQVLIKNQRQFDWQGSFNLQSLYNKNKYLKKINQKFMASSRVSARQPEKKKKEVKLEKEIQLSPDSGTIVQRGMFTKKVRITARGADGKVYSIKYNPINYARVMILNKDTARLKLTIVPGPQPLEGTLTKVAEYSSRFLMMVRRVNIQYSLIDGMMLSGYAPEVGDMFGQRRTGTLAPGLGFAFGAVRRSFIDEADERGWLVKNENMTTPAMINSAKNLTIRANLEPIAGLKIDLNANRVDTRSTDIYYMQDGMPEQMGGSFTMTTIALGSAFGGSGNANNGYSSKAFDKFIAHRSVIAQRLMDTYSGTVYPSSGFMAGHALAGKPYDPAVGGGVSLNSMEVLVPAFLAAYTGKDPNKVGLSAFPSVKSLLPNWRVTYDGLIRIPVIRKYFKSMMLSHQYRCSYSVGAFSSFLDWVDAGQDGLGYIRDIQTGNPTPSSPYDIAAVSITEGFSPLFGVDATLLNNITGKFELRKTRNLSLNISSYQLVEALSNEFVIGVGYKLTEFNKVLKMKKTRDFSNDLTIRLDFSYRKMQSLIRKIEDQFTQATSGNIAKTIQFSADYGLSRALTLRAFYDLQINEPIVSTSSYPTSNSNYGISLRFSLAQ